MKKIYFYGILPFLLFAMSIFISCEKKKITGVNGKEYYNVDEAIKSQDFEAAYKFIAKYNGTREEQDKLFRAEVIYLMGLDTEESKKRIIFLLAEYTIPGKQAKLCESYKKRIKNINK